MMKMRLFFGLLVFILFNSIEAKVPIQDKEIKPACIKFGEKTHNVGSFLSICPIVVHTFYYTNIGEKPLVIHDVDPGCSCVRVEFSKKPILKGQRGAIKVTYDASKKYYGYFMRPIAVKANGKIERTVLYLKGYMIPPATDDNKQ